MATKIYDPQVKIPGYLKISKIAVWLLYLWVLFGIIMLALRVFLLAFSANTTVGFGHFVIETSASYLQPFRTLFPPHPVGDTGYLDVSALFAIVVYLFVAWGISALVKHIQQKIDLSMDTQQKMLDDAKREKQIARAAASRNTKPAPTRRVG